MDSVNIRPASTQDLDTFRRLSSMLFESDSRFNSNFNKKWPFQPEAEQYFATAVEKGLCLLAESEEVADPVGFLDASLHEDATATILRSEIGQIYVLPGWRRKGIGRKLIDGYLSWCRFKDVREIVVGVFEANVEAVAFYRSIGLDRWIVKLNGAVDELMRQR